MKEITVVYPNDGDNGPEVIADCGGAGAMIAAPYVRTLLGWYNITINGAKYNVGPDIFRSITGVSDRAQCGIAELTAAEAEALIRAGIAL